MNSSHHSEAELVGLIQTGGSVDLHLEVCPMCRERFNFLQRFYAAFVEEQQRPRGPDIERLIAGLSGRKIVRLHRYTPQADLSQFGANGNVVVLAAQGSVKEESRFVLVGSFAAEREHFLLRVVRDRDLVRDTLYLLTPQPEDGRNARITIGDSKGGQVVAETNDVGIAVLEGEQAVDWPHAVIAVEPHPN
jgi:hypothetical protein